MYYKAVNNVV